MDWARHRNYSTLFVSAHTRARAHRGRAAHSHRSLNILSLAYALACPTISKPINNILLLEKINICFDIFSITFCALPVVMMISSEFLLFTVATMPEIDSATRHGRELLCFTKQFFLRLTIYCHTSTGGRRTWRKIVDTPKLHNCHGKRFVWRSMVR